MEAGRVIGEKYRLEREVARGGMGAVWIARHIGLEVDVAIKVMNKGVLSAPKALERFRREARAAARLKSPNIVHIYDYGIHDGSPYMAMELLEGTDLRSHLDTHGPLSLERVRELLRPIGKALRLAHEAGLVHRDLKPANIFLARSGDEEVIKVLDFGIAKELRPAPDQSVTGSDVLLGTPAYMSPEQARGADLDARADVWSIGVIVFEMLTGLNPFRGAALGEVFAKIGYEPLPVPSHVLPGLPPGLDDFMARALARNPSERFQSITALVSALDAVAQGRPLPVEPAPARPTIGRDLEPTGEVDTGRAAVARSAAIAPTLKAHVAKTPGVSQDETAPPAVSASRTTRRSPRRLLAAAAMLVAGGSSVAIWRLSISGEGDLGASDPTATERDSSVAPRAPAGDPALPDVSPGSEKATDVPVGGASLDPVVGSAASAASPTTAVTPTPSTATWASGGDVTSPKPKPKPPSTPAVAAPASPPAPPPAASAAPAAPGASTDPIFGVKVPK